MKFSCSLYLYPLNILTFNLDDFEDLTNSMLSLVQLITWQQLGDMHCLKQIKTKISNAMLLSHRDLTFNHFPVIHRLLSLLINTL